MPTPAHSHNQHPSKLFSIISRLLSFHAAVLGVLLLVACAGNTATSPRDSTPTTTATPATPKGTVLFKADWSHGLQGWQGASGWQVKNNELYSKNDNLDELIVPYTPSINSYAIEIKVQVIKYKERSGGSFNFTTNQRGQDDGYLAGVSNLITPDVQVGGLHPQLHAYIIPQVNALHTQSPIDYEPRTQVHVYRLEIHDNILDFYADGVKSFTASSAVSSTLSHGPLHIKVHNIILRMASLTITTL